METAALPADGLRQHAAVTRRTPLVLCEMIDLYATEFGRSRAAAAYDLEQLFNAIDRHTLAPSDNLFRPGLYPSPLDPSVCWVGLAADPLAASSEHPVYARDLAGYFQQRKRGARSPAPYVECGGGGYGSRHDASDEAVYLAPELLARLIEASGQRVPAFLLSEPAPAEAPAPDPTAGTGRKRATRQAAPVPAAKQASPRATLDARELTTARRILRAAVLITATAAQDKRPEVRRKAAELDLAAAPYTTARQLIDLADLLGIDDLPRKPETIIKFLKEPGAD